MQDLHQYKPDFYPHLSALTGYTIFMIPNRKIRSVMYQIAAKYRTRLLLNLTGAADPSIEAELQDGYLLTRFGRYQNLHPSFESLFFFLEVVSDVLNYKTPYCSAYIAKVSDFCLLSCISRFDIVKNKAHFIGRSCKLSVHSETA